MITVRKLQSLSQRTRERKILRILEQAELSFVQGLPVDGFYLKRVVSLLDSSCMGVVSFLEYPIPENGTVNPMGKEHITYRRVLNDLRHSLAKSLGESPGDWDFIDIAGGEEEPRIANTYPMQVYVDDVRSPFNVGSLFRTAEAFGVSEMMISSGTAAIDHPRTYKTARGTIDMIPHRIIDQQNTSKRSLLDHLPSGTPLFAMETGGTPLGEFVFPSHGVLIVGSEELGVSPELLEEAKSSYGVVTIPMVGVKGSLNVSAAFAIVLSRWFESLSS